jgi:nitrite reductase/ring-hydroxylating ferredoxin subunit
MYVDVGASQDFPEASVRIVTAAGREIGVVRWHGEMLALNNVCPHQYAPVCRGTAMPMIVGDEAGAIDVDDETLVIVCPWHGWEFDARTGRAAWGSSRFKLKTYDATEQDGRVLVDLPRANGGQPAESRIGLAADVEAM